MDDDESREGGMISDNDTQSEDAGDTDPSAKRPIRFPASMGLSVFLPPGDADFVEADVRFADYDKVDTAEDTEQKKSTRWKRVPHEQRGIRIDLDRAKLESKEGFAIPNTTSLDRRA